MRRKMETDDVDRLVDSVGGESEVTSVSSQKLEQSDAIDSHSSDEDILYIFLKCADVNIMCVVAMRSIGRRMSAAKEFSGFMNLPNPVTY